MSSPTTPIFRDPIETAVEDIYQTMLQAIRDAQAGQMDDQLASAYRRDIERFVRCAGERDRKIADAARDYVQHAALNPRAPDDPQGRFERLTRLCGLVLDERKEAKEQTDE